MSTTTQKRTYTQALADAEAFRALFPADSYERWEFAGSIRRKKRDVSDIDHVVIARVGEIDKEGDLFAKRETGNLLWHHMDKRLADHTIAKHIYGASGPRWGERLRGSEFRGFKHEIWLANPENWGSALAIRTGPGDYSRMLVTKLQFNGYMNHKGYVWNKNDWACPCGWRGSRPIEVAGSLPGGFVRDPEGRESGPTTATCPQCGPTTIVHPLRVPAADEQTYFKLCGVSFVQPERRG